MNFIRRILKLMAGSFDEVVTKSLIVRDQNGRARVCIGTAPNNSAGVTVSDEKGRVRAALIMGSDERPALELLDSVGRERVTISTAPDNSAGLTLRDQTGRVRAALSMASDERPALDLFDSVGRARVTIVVGLDGTPTVHLKDEQETLCASLMVVKAGPALLLTRPGVGVVKVAVPGRSAQAMTREETLALSDRVAEAESPAAVEDVIMSTFGHGPNVIELREENGVLVWGVPNISK